MSRGKNLQEMENAVTKGAKPAEPMQTMAGVSYEDLGGPTPENNSPTDDSNKLKDPAGEGSYAANLKSVKGVMAKSKMEEVETEEEVIAEDEIAEEEVVALYRTCLNFNSKWCTIHLFFYLVSYRTNISKRAIP